MGEEVNIDGNGHTELSPADQARLEKLKEVLPGATIEPKDWDFEEGSISKAAHELTKARSGVIIQILSAPGDQETRQILKNALWQNYDEADRAVAAIEECEMCGLPITHVMNKIVAHTAGTQGWLLRLAAEMITHTTFTTNSPTNGKKHWWQAGNKNGSISGSPLQ